MVKQLFDIFDILQATQIGFGPVSKYITLFDVAVYDGGKAAKEARATRGPQSSRVGGDGGDGPQAAQPIG